MSNLLTFLILITILSNFQCYSYNLFVRDVLVECYMRNDGYFGLSNVDRRPEMRKDSDTVIVFPKIF